MLVCCWIIIQSLYTSFISDRWIDENKLGKWLHYEETKVTAFPHSGVFPMKLNLINTCMLESCIPTYCRDTAAPHLAVSHFYVQAEIQAEE